MEQWMPGAAAGIQFTSKLVGEAEIVYRKEIDRERKKLLQPRGNDFYIPVKLLRHRVPLGTLLYELLTPFGFMARQLPDALQLMDSESGRYLLSPSHRLIRNRDFLIITARAEREADIIVVDDFTQEIHTAQGTFTFRTTADLSTLLDTGNEAAMVDAAQLAPPVILRRWKQGDYFYPLGMGMKKKKVSRFLIDQKVSLHEKEKIWVLESNRRIVWIAGYRLDERFKITPATKEGLRVTYKKDS
jgi:tRNA(Ile)-lysidine synthase